ncbi:MAG: hypothetical protein ACM3WQ_00110 [Chloroflexota bacterium]
MIPMKLIAYLTTFIIALLLVVTVQIALAQDISVGLKPNDTFTYSVTGSYSSNAPITDVPNEVLNAEASDYFKVTVTNVSSPNIGYTWLWHFINGTEQTGDGITNIEIPSESVGPFYLIVSANLTTNDSIHPHFGPTTKFNESFMYTYTNYTRATNQLHTQIQEANNQTSTIKYRTVDTDTYYDKLTGMMVYFNEKTNYQNPTFETTITWKLLGQNAWTYSSTGSYPPEPFFTLPVIIAIVVVVAILVVIVGWFISNKRSAARRKQLLHKK